MRDHTRRAVAFVTGTLMQDHPRGQLYDYDAHKYFIFSFNKAGDSLSIYDYSERCFIAGNRSSTDEYSLYHYGNRKFLTLKINNNRFDGYDYDSGKFFNGTVSGNAVSLYDYEHSKYFNYNI